MSQPDGPVALRTRPLILWLAIIGVLMVVVGVILDRNLDPEGPQSLALGIRNLIFPNSEGNLFSWYSSLLLAGIGIGFLLIAAATRGTGRSVLPFLVMAGIALFLSADEAALLHERLGKLAAVFGLSASFTYQWLLLGVPIAIVIGLLLLWLARSLDPVLRRRLVIAGIVFLAGAVGGEFIGALITKVDFGLASAAKANLHGISVVIEEGLEILGAVLALRAVLAHLNISTGPEGLAFELPPYVPRAPKKT
jgi:hypothetical protein